MKTAGVYRLTALPTGGFIRQASPGGFEDQSAEDWIDIFLFFKRKIPPYSLYTYLVQATWRREASADSYGTSGTGEIGFAAKQ
ncbi:hypothetical protein [Domibacillus robiginosus]|uniref:hypothetical protein n=1 Tax=Domibacillus robiginosus TaxID=1071054 RepID=UPI00067CC579|nr:hypothetical protein [Domibacillus robiginosus]